MEVVTRHKEINRRNDLTDNNFIFQTPYETPCLHFKRFVAWDREGGQCVTAKVV